LKEIAVYMSCALVSHAAH